MAQEFVIKSKVLEDKVNQLLPSQGGSQAGVDLSASTMVVPIVDLTESAEGSEVRQDLQTSFSVKSITAFSISGASTTIINTTGYFRVFGAFSCNTTVGSASFTLFDGTTSKVVFQSTAAGSPVTQQFDFNVFLSAGDSLIGTSSVANMAIVGNTRQIADISGNLVDP